MATADDLRRVALGLQGTVAALHFDRTAFKVARTYATLAADGASFNIKLPLEENDAFQFGEISCAGDCHAAITAARRLQSR